MTTLLLQLLLHNMQSSVWKLIGQYDYPKLECHVFVLICRGVSALSTDDVTDHTTGGRHFVPSLRPASPNRVSNRLPELLLYVSLSEWSVITEPLMPCIHITLSFGKRFFFLIYVGHCSLPDVCRKFIVY